MASDINNVSKKVVSMAHVAKRTKIDKFQLLDGISKLYLNPHLSDLIIVVNNENIYAHRLVLGLRSKFFYRELYDDKDKDNFSGHLHQNNKTSSKEAKDRKTTRPSQSQ